MSANYPCEICGRDFAKSSKLARHMQVHTKSKDFKCHLCDKRYSRAEHLARHALSHETSEELRKPFKCEECDSRFASNYHLKRHVKQVHDPDEAFECDICHETFKKKSKLKQHKAKEHAEKKETTSRKSYECLVDGCEFVGSTWTEFQAHISSSHPPTCPVCNKTFTRTYGLKCHLKTSGHGQTEDDDEQVDLSSRRKFPCEHPGCTKGFMSVRCYSCAV